MEKYSLELEGKKRPLCFLSTVLKVVLVVGTLILIIGLVLTIIGLVELSKNNCSAKTSKTGISKSKEYSAEAKRVGLDSFLQKVQTTYYKLNPNKVVYAPDSTFEVIRADFSPYNCHPDFIKNRTDTALKMYNEAKQILNSTVQEKLKPREAKAIAQVLHFLQSNFGSPYDENYYAGDWMLGPNLFCWQAVCYVGSDLQVHFTSASYGFKPKTVEDVEFIIDSLKKIKASMEQYVDNLKEGIKAGFVRSVEQCEAGLFAIQRKYKRIAQVGPQGKA